MSERIQAVVDDVLRPLLQRDGSDIELVSADTQMVTVAVSGRAAFGAGSVIIQSEIIRPAIHKAAGTAIELNIVRMIPKARTNTP